MLLEKLKIETTTTVCNDKEVLVLLLTDKVEGRFKIGENIDMNLTIRILVLDIIIISSMLNVH